MNNKYLKYFLLVAVVGIWATIIYRLINGMSGPSSPHAARIGVSRTETRIAADTFSLYADYPDPFLPESDTAGLENVPKQPPPPPVNIGLHTNPGPAKEAISGIIQFNGIITNPQKRSMVAIITIRGKEFLVREGEKIEDIRIRKINKVRILISYKGEPFTIEK